VSCVLLFTLERDDLAVDTHVHRLAGRLGWVPPRQGDKQPPETAASASASASAAAPASLLGPSATGSKAAGSSEWADADVLSVVPPPSAAPQASAASASPRVKASNKRPRPAGGIRVPKWPRGRSRELSYDHLNAVVPDALKYPLHLLLIQRES
jgi:hypothetical protein